MSDILVREYQPVDREAVEECIFELQEENYALEPHFWTKPEEVRGVYLESLIPEVAAEDGKIFVAEAEGRVVGFIATTVAGTHNSPDVALKSYGFVIDLAVLKSERNKGYGKALLAKAEEYMKGKGLEWMQLNVHRKNPAVDFYKNMDYRERTVRMEKRLS